MNASERILDILTKHSVDLQRYGNATVRKVIALMKRAEADILGQVVAADPEGKTVDRLNELIEAIRRINAGAAQQIQRALENELTQLGAYEATFTRDLLRTTVPVRFDVVTPAAEQIAAATLARPFQGRLLREWITGLEAGAQARVRDAIRLGVVEGETTQQIVTRIRGTKANAYKDGVFETSRRGAESMVRTAINHTANYSREEVYKAQGDLVKGIKWVSTLDARTTAVCFTGETTVAYVGSLKKIFRAQYSGEIITVTTAGGKKIEGTPNHPILTANGFLPLGELDPSKHVVYSVFDEIGGVTVNENVGVEPTFSQLFDAVNKPAISDIFRESASPVDFYGDGVGMNDKIDIATPKSELGRDFKAALGKGFINKNLGGNIPKLTLAHDCGSNNRIIAGFPAIQPAKRDTGILDDGEDVFPGPVWEHLGNLSRSHPGLVKIEHSSSISHETSVTLSALHGGHCSGLLEHVGDCGCGCAVSPANGSGALSVFVCEENIVSVVREFRDCHVYTLQTDLGFYIAGGIIVKNCQARDGEVYKIGEGPRPPAHIGCRSTTVPVIASWKDLGFDVDDVPPAERASMNGQVPADMTYGEWLKKQPNAVIEEALGKTKAKLFTDGNLPVDRFVNNFGVELTLDELRGRDAAAFNRAGL